MISGNMFDTFPLLYQPLNSQSTIGNILKSEIKKIICIMGKFPIWPVFFAPVSMFVGD